MAERPRTCEGLFDPVLEIDPAVTVDSITAQDIKKLQNGLAIVRHAGAIPRRVGGGVDPTDLARDKRVARRVAGAMAKSLESWGGEDKPSEPTAKQRQAGAQMIWEDWVNNRITYCRNRMVYIATFGKRNPEHKGWANKTINRLYNETKWLEYALR